MANVVATNAKTQVAVLWWLDLGADTPVVYSYECGTDAHKVVSSVSLTSADAVCPVHGDTLTGGAAVDVT